MEGKPTPVERALVLLLEDLMARRVALVRSMSLQGLMPKRAARIFTDAIREEVHEIGELIKRLGKEKRTTADNAANGGQRGHE